jgi:hypothetical protein
MEGVRQREAFNEHLLLEWTVGKLGTSPGDWREEQIETQKAAKLCRGRSNNWQLTIALST